MSKFRQLLLLALLCLACGQTVAQDYDNLVQQALQERNAGNMATAETLLRQAYTIPPDKTEVAYLLGFSDCSNFSRAFHRWTGQSPSDFRDKSKAEIYAVK